MEDVGEKFRRAIDRIKLHAGKCAASTELEDLKSAVELAKERVSQAKTAGEFLKADSRVLGILNDAEKHLGDFGRVVGGIQDICKDIDALIRVHSAVRILKDDDIIYRNPEKAARAFGQLFVGFGRFCRFLEPLKPWGQFFESAGDFFVNVRNGIAPETKPTHKRIIDQVKKECGDWKLTGTH